MLITIKAQGTKRRAQRINPLRLAPCALCHDDIDRQPKGPHCNGGIRYIKTGPMIGANGKIKKVDHLFEAQPVDHITDGAAKDQ